MNLQKVLPLALLFISSVKCLASPVRLETVVMQIRSKMDDDGDDYLQKIQATTTQYLNDYYHAYYGSTDENLFDRTELTVSSFGIQGIEKSFISTVQVDTTLSFNEDTEVPDVNFLNTLLANAFQGVNLDLFVTNLVTTDNVFLERLTHLVIEINDSHISAKNLEGDDPVDGISAANDGFVLQEWAEIAIFVAAGVVGVLLLMAIYYFLKCCCCQLRKVEDDPETMKLRSIEVPHGKHTLQTDMSKSQPQPQRNKFQKKSPCTFYQSQVARERSLSPARSLASQDSSLFTYNPKSTMSAISKATFSVGSTSNFNIDMQHVDLEAWTRANTISPVQPAPFGHDISAIQRDRDLSLIEEGDEVPKARSRVRPVPSGLELRNSRARRQSRTMLDSKKDLCSEESEDVMADLRNLSAQIDRHRHGGQS